MSKEGKLRRLAKAKHIARQKTDPLGVFKLIGNISNKICREIDKRMLDKFNEHSNAYHQDSSCTFPPMPIEVPEDATIVIR